MTTRKPKTLRGLRKRTADLFEQVKQSNRALPTETDEASLTWMREQRAIAEDYVALYTDALDLVDCDTVEWSACWDARTLHEYRLQELGRSIESTTARIADRADGVTGGAR